MFMGGNLGPLPIAGLVGRPSQPMTDDDFAVYVMPFLGLAFCLFPWLAVECGWALRPRQASRSASHWS